jgi:hypothetical protein
VERGVFPKLEVKKILTPNFVEARIHTDLTESHPHFKLNKRIQEIRARFLGAGNIGLPQYIVVDPMDPFRAIVKLSGSAKASTFIRFFKKASEQSQ